MSSFAYRASTREGRVIEGVVEADGEAAVVADLRRQGCIPLSVELAGSVAPQRRFSFSLPSLSRGPRIKGRDLMLFTRELATLLQAGLPLDRSLQSLASLSSNQSMKKVVTDVLVEVQEGKSLSEALANHAEVFPPLYLNLVRAGEAGGVMESTLDRLATYLESSEKTRDEIRSALTYPLILALVGSGSILILLTYVLPKFSVVFADLGVAMPMSTRLVMRLSDIVQNYWWAVLLATACGVLLFNRYTATPAGRLRYDKWKLSLPVFGKLVQEIQVARFARTLGTMLNSGVPLLKALDIVRSLATSSVVAEALASVQTEVSEGKGLAGPLGQSGVFPPMALQMVAVGEETGRLDDMLLIVGDHFDREVSNTVSRLMSLLEPAMLLIMGLVAGFIVIAMMSAVFSVNQVSF